MMGVFVKVGLAIALLDIMAIVLFPVMVSMFVLLTSGVLVYHPFSILLTLLKLRTTLHDSIAQFNYHRKAYDKALSRLQELIVIL